MKQLLCILLAAAALAVAMPASNAPAADGIVPVPSQDAEMNAAIAKARQSLSAFWQAHEKPAPGIENLALKVRIVDSDGRAEHFWLVNVAREGDAYVGFINNEPAIVKSVSNGQRYTFQDSQISDWMFVRNGKIVGNETMRPLLKRMPPEQAKYYSDMLEKP